MGMKIDFINKGSRFQKKKTIISGFRDELVEYLSLLLNLVTQDLKECIKELKRYLCTYVSVKEQNGIVVLEINGDFRGKLEVPS